MALEKVIERIAYGIAFAHGRTTKKRIGEALAAEIEAGALPPRTKTRLIPVVAAEIERQARVRSSRYKRPDPPPPASAAEVLYHRYAWFEQLPKRMRHLKGGRFFNKLVLYFHQRQCAVCNNTRAGFGFHTYPSSRRNFVEEPLTRLVLHDGERLCEECLAVVQTHEGKGPPAPVPLVAALWAVNRHAKRYRDLSQEAYRKRHHRWARWYSRRKGKMYALKEQTVHHLHAAGVLRVVGHHRFGDNYAEVLEAEGHRFHRPCPPVEGDVEDMGGIEAKSIDASEPRLVDALHNVRAYLADKPKAEVYRWPARPRPTWDDWDDDDDDDWDDEWDDE